LFYKPGGTLMTGHFFGTLFLTQASQAAREFARVVLAIRIPDDNLSFGATYLSSVYVVEPRSPEMQRRTDGVPNYPADMEGLRVNAHAPWPNFEGIYTIELENGWSLSYALSTVAPPGVTV
jgi:hypothetical protein